MRAGKLSRVIFIEREIVTVNDAGYSASTWALVGTVRAELVQAAISETPTGYGEAGAIGTTFRTRYFNGLTTADRIRYLGRHYNVTGIAELGIRAGLEITAKAIE